MFNLLYTVQEVLKGTNAKIQHHLCRNSQSTHFCIKSGIPNDRLCCTISFRSFPILTVKMPWWKMSNYLKCNIFKMLVLSMPRILISYLVKSSRGRGAKVSVLFYHIRAQRSYGVWAAGGCSRVPTLFGQWVDHGLKYHFKERLSCGNCALESVINRTVVASGCWRESLGTITSAGTHLGSLDTITWVSK